MPKKPETLQSESRLKGNLKNLQGARKEIPTATPEEAQERKAELRTQGKKGARCERYNMAFTPDNYDYINIVSKIKGMTKTKFVNQIIAEYRANNSEIYEKAKAIIEES